MSEHKADTKMLTFWKYDNKSYYNVAVHQHK